MKRIHPSTGPAPVALILAGSLAYASAASAATTIVVDSFDSVLFAVNTVGPTTSGPTDISADSDIPGIFREVSIGILTGTGVALANNLLGTLNYDNGALTRSFLNFQYVFPAYDLAATGATSFSYLLLTTEPGKHTDYTFTIESPDGTATLTGDLPLVAGLISFNLASLTVAGTPFDDMTKVTFEMRPQVVGTDMVIDSYGFELPPPTPVPEAGTFAAVGFVGALAGWSYRRVRRAAQPAR
jgi:hypothetical protein